MSRRFTSADALTWLEINVAVEYAIKNPKELKVADLVTPKSWQALVYLDTRKGRAAEYQTLAAHLRLDKSAMTRVVGILEDARYITSGFHSVNGRKLLTLTTDGQDAIGKMVKHAAEKVDFSITTHSE